MYSLAGAMLNNNNLMFESLRMGGEGVYADTVQACVRLRTPCSVTGVSDFREKRLYCMGNIGLVAQKELPFEPYTL